MKIPRYVVLDKVVGETPLSCLESWRKKQGRDYANLPLAYAGRLDPLASGKLLVLIGNECKVQTNYHSLDKTYELSILFGVGSDTGDVMGRLNGHPYRSTNVPKINVASAIKKYHGVIALPFPIFSAKTVQGKPLHTWAVEGRLDEITIPTQTSTIYHISHLKVESKMRVTIYKDALKNINSIPKVTDERKALGNDFRRDDIRHDWDVFQKAGAPSDRFTIAHMRVTCSSGTYMRSLAEAIGHDLGHPALATCIHRTHIGRFVPLPIPLFDGFWRKSF